MKIGLRTIKTVIASVLAILIATQLHLLYATAAVIIAILSVGNTKKTSLKSGLGRLLSLGVAIILSFIYLVFITQRILVDLARPFLAHSCADGRITSFA